MAALRAGEAAPADIELVDDETRTRERLVLGLRLDEPVVVADVAPALDHEALRRLVAGRLVELRGGDGVDTMTLTRRGRFLGGGVTAELLELASA
jgi:coproporphyrinogen III oxidase-like Fe-S oxidoreductase